MKLGKAMILLAFAAGIVILTWKTQASEAPGWDHDDINLSWINSDDETDYSLNGVDDLMAHSIPEGSEVPPLHQQAPGDGANSVEDLTRQKVKLQNHLQEITAMREDEKKKSLEIDFIYLGALLDAQIKTKQELEELEGQIAQQSAGGAAVPQNGKL
eukprot:GHVT01030590.1.p1 GENE.GHVT01030590.1~~GHVT01030590.1.p1  ORF type:complete len:157 (+),score=15.61 GHVT01030590.1:123-593(+)